jgi:negative regulator of sigma E activity
MFRCVSKGVKATRKNGRYRSLSHDRKIVQDLYSENLKKFFGFKNGGIGTEETQKKIESDGLSTLDYEVLEEKNLSDRVIHVKVRI